MPKANKSINVQRPVPSSVPGVTRNNKKVRSAAAWMDKDEKRNIERFKNYVDYAPKIILPVSLRMLQSEKPNSKTLVERTRTLLQPSQPVRCTSAQYCDRNGVPLLYYFGRRLVREDDKKNVKLRFSPEDHYDGQSVSEIEAIAKQDTSVRLVRDGLDNFKCDNYQNAVQALAVATKLHTLYDETRHEGKNTMDYTVSKSDVDDISSDMSVSSEGCDVGGREDVVSQDEADYFDNDQSMQDDGDNYGEHVPIWGGDSEIGAQDFVDYLDDDEEFDDEDDGDVAFEDDEINMDAYETVDNGDNGVRKTEQGGVIHLVHGWTQRAHPNELYISGDITGTSTRVAAAGSYYSLTEPIARTVALAFKTVFPESARKYQEAFDAGVWFADDPGPFLGRAVVYKLQGRLHRDRHDVGPSVSFPVGQFSGGEMVFPQLNIKLQYSPGDFCIFYSSIIYHKVAPFIPSPQTNEQVAQKITPGRIGSVFFFPSNSLRILTGKPKRWGYRTAFGANEDLYSSAKKKPVTDSA